MATAGSKQGGGGSSKPPAADEEFDPRYEWQENASSFILRIHLSGFRKQDFRVQVDGAGRLTVRGKRSDAGTNAKHSRFSKVFQLPSTSNLDDIAGRFDAGVLTLTIPKKQQAQAHQAPTQEQLPKAPPPQEQEQEQRRAKEDQQQQANKPKDDAINKPAAEQVAGAMSGGKPEPEQQHKTAAAAAAPPPPAAAGKEEEEGKPKAGAAPPAPATESDTRKPAAAPEPEPPQADAERKAAADPASESLLADTTVKKRRADEERANKAAAEAADQQGRIKACCRGFKERVAAELQGLAGSEWAEGLVDTVKRNREVIAAAVAAFSLGVFVSTRLFARSTRN